MGVVVLLLVWSLTVYRATRVIILDTFVDGVRERLHEWLLEDRDRFSGVAQWFHELLSCPYCVSPWLAAGVLGSHRVFAGSFPMPVWLWAATAALALVWYRLIEA